MRLNGYYWVKISFDLFEIDERPITREGFGKGLQAINSIRAIKEALEIIKLPYKGNIDSVGVDVYTKEGVYSIDCSGKAKEIR